MLLLGLPPEILRCIFDQVGPPFFREDLSRLTVCKTWFNHAMSTFYKSIELSQAGLSNLIDFGRDGDLSLLKATLQTIDLEFKGFPAYTFTTDAQSSDQSSTTPGTVISHATHDHAPVQSWINRMNSNITQLGNIAQQCERLRTLYLRAWSEARFEPTDPQMHFLSLPAMRKLLFLKNLRVLTLDLSVGFLRTEESRGQDIHVCPVIGALLHNLRTLHLRSQRVCPDILKPQVENDSLNLSVVAINLSLSRKIPGITSAAHSKRCGSQSGSFLELKSDLEEQARALIDHMESPRIIRILDHTFPLFELRSFDVGTGDTMLLDDSKAWDEDGETLGDSGEDSEQESEIRDSEFDSFSDD